MSSLRPDLLGATRRHRFPVDRPLTARPDQTLAPNGGGEERSLEGVRVPPRPPRSPLEARVGAGRDACLVGFGERGRTPGRLPEQVLPHLSCERPLKARKARSGWRGRPVGSRETRSSRLCSRYTPQKGWELGVGWGGGSRGAVAPEPALRSPVFPSTVSAQNSRQPLPAPRAQLQGPGAGVPAGQAGVAVSRSSGPSCGAGWGDRLEEGDALMAVYITQGGLPGTGARAPDWRLKRGCPRVKSSARGPEGSRGPRGSCGQAGRGGGPRPPLGGGARASGPGDCGGGAAGKFPGRPRGAPSPGGHRAARGVWPRRARGR